MLTVGQAVYLGAYANDSSPASSPSIVALARPLPSTMAGYRAALEEETRAVVQTGHVIPGVAIYAHNFGYDEASRLAKDGVLIGSESVDNYIDLDSGNILLTPDKDIVVNTHEGKIYIKAGATVFIAKSGNNVVVYDLMQTSPKQVSVAVKKHNLILEPGRMLVLTGHNIQDFEKLEDGCHCVAYRNAKPVLLNGNGSINAFLADFSIASAMVTIQPLQRLTVSNNKQDKLSVEKLVKAAVILGDFATTVQPDVVRSDNAVTTVKATKLTGVRVADDSTTDTDIDSDQ